MTTLENKIRFEDFDFHNKLPVVCSSFIQNLQPCFFFFCSTQLSSACYNPSFMSLLHAFTACRYSLFHHLLHSLSSLCFSVLLLSQSIPLPAQTRSIIVSGQSLPLLPKVRLSVRSLDRSAGSNKPRAERSGADAADSTSRWSRNEP